ncbi:MAG: chorismate synthase [Promethearchaeota archaeon]
MVGNTLGSQFRVTLYGESHGTCIGVILDGVPAGLKLDLEEVQRDLDRRRPGQSVASTSRAEKDEFSVRSGLFENRTTGAPICLEVPNRDVDSSSYYEIRDTPRPSHADLSAGYRYGGFHDFRGSGRFSGRLTAGLVMAGSVARQVLRQFGVEVRAYTRAIGGIVDEKSYSISEVDAAREENPVRAVDLETASKMLELVEKVRGEGDSIGGVVHCRVENVPRGLGDPFFDSLESLLAHAIFSIPAVRGVEFGSGFRSTSMRGSEHNDPLRYREGEVVVVGNHSGGIVGGITTGAPVEINVAFKPTASIGLPQETVDLKAKKNATITVKGRHDPVIVPRAVPVVEATVAIVILELMLRLGKVPPVLNN